MVYRLPIDPYIDPTSGILTNLLHITAQYQLDLAEADITVVAIATLSEHPIEGVFDLKHLQAVHAHLFGSLFAWAGKLRTVEMSKGQTRFAPATHLERAAANLCAELADENWLLDLKGDEYVERFAHYYCEVNVLHPFREGNGRTQRAFFSLLAQRSGRHVAWEKLDQTENIMASIAGYHGDERRLVKLLRPLITT